MSPINRLVAAAAIVLAVGGLSAFVFSNRSGGPGATPSPSPSPSPSPTIAPSPSASPVSTTGWVPFTSSHYGYTIAYPPTSVATQATRDWATLHPGLTLLVIDGARGAVVTGRNAQGALVLPPIQQEPLLHRMLPTLPAEIESRYDQLQQGLATRLDALRPSFVDAGVLQRLAAHDTARWPEHYGCWSASERRIVELPAPDPAQRRAWADAVRETAARCKDQ